MGIGPKLSPRNPVMKITSYNKVPSKHDPMRLRKPSKHMRSFMQPTRNVICLLELGIGKRVERNNKLKTDRK